LEIEIEGALDVKTERDTSGGEVKEGERKESTTVKEKREKKR
jgi:hypothetical protein